jgi:hypothetical protein
MMHEEETRSGTARNFAFLAMFASVLYLVLVALGKATPMSNASLSANTIAYPVVPKSFPHAVRKKEKNDWKKIFRLWIPWAVIVAAMCYRSCLLWPYFRACYLVPSRDWVQTQGVVSSATVDKSYYGGRSHYWQVRPLYSYTVGSRTFEGTLFQVTPRLTYQQALHTARQLQVSPRVPVYYDKTSPTFRRL